MGSSNINLSAIETRIRIMDQMWVKFESQHDLIRAAFKEKFKDSEYTKSDLFEQTESTYVVQRSTLAEAAERYKTPAATSIAPSASNAQNVDRTPKTALPRIILPQFSGAYKEWPAFRDLF
ncbi:unnamed protein product [Lasius platythorax]|uniref:Uncharacterized protein n=1 Tax=Lasius platythorax TaxID=488582 RepID=A0AAV2MW92_9HYME